MNNLRKGKFSLHLLYVKQYRTRTTNFLWSKSDLQNEKKRENKFACRIYQDLNASIVTPCLQSLWWTKPITDMALLFQEYKKSLVWILLLKEARAQKKVAVPWILRAAIKKRCRIMLAVTYFTFCIVTKKLKCLENYWPMWLHYNIL